MNKTSADTACEVQLDNLRTYDFAGVIVRLEFSDCNNPDISATVKRLLVESFSNMRRRPVASNF